MRTQRQKSVLRALLISLGCGVLLAGGLWLLLKDRVPSSRLRVMEPHIKFEATLSNLKHVADENGIPFELHDRCNWPACASVPLDGSMTGKRLEFFFYASGELQSAYIVKESGEVEKCLLAVDKK